MPRTVRGHISKTKEGKPYFVPQHPDKRDAAKPEPPKQRRTKAEADEEAIGAAVKRATSERKPKAKKKAKPAIMPRLMGRISKLLTVGRAKVEKKGTKYEAYAKPEGRKNWKALGSFRSHTDALLAVAKEFGADQPGYKTPRGYEDVGAKAGGAPKDRHIKRRTFEDIRDYASFKALEFSDPAMASKYTKKLSLWPTPSIEELKKSGKGPDWAAAVRIVHSLIPKLPKDDDRINRLVFASCVYELKRICDSSSTGNEIFSALKSKMNNIVSMRGSRYTEDTDFEKESQEGTSTFTYIDSGRLRNFFIYQDGRVGGERYYEWKHKFNHYDKNPDDSWAMNWKYVEIAFPQRAGGKQGEPGTKVEKLKTKAQLAAEQAKAWERSVPQEYERKGGRASTARRPLDFLKQFHLAGVEYGKWVDNAHGKQHSERFSEALMDLADAVGLSDKDMAIGGRLIMAFGSRGKAKASGHYEPNNVLINLTRDHGAGSLAHEWMHFLDHTIERLVSGDTRKPTRNANGDVKHVTALTTAMASDMVGGKEKGRSAHGFISDPVELAMQDVVRAIIGGPTKKVFTPAPDRDKTEWRSSSLDSYLVKSWGDPRLAFDRWKEEYPGAPANQIQNVLDFMSAHTGWKETLTIDMDECTSLQSAYYQAMVAMDGGKRGKYWSKPCEMVARSFEGYVADKLARKGRANNYLVKNEKIQGEFSPISAIPSERKYINEAFDKLFAAIKGEGTLKKSMEILDELAVMLTPNANG